MSYVRRTNTLVESVQDKVSTMRMNALRDLDDDTKVEIGTPLYDELVSAMYDTAWSEAPELREKMPTDWCQKATDVRLKVPMAGSLFGSVHETIGAKTDTSFKMPPTWRRWDDIELSESVNTSPLVKDWVERKHERERERAKTSEMFEKIERQLTKYLYSHASLNAAIKEMPELEMYVPEEYLSRLAEKTVRPKKEKEDTTVEKLDIDVNTLTQVAVADRIKNSGVS